MLVTAIVSITLALIFYSLGVWAEKLQGILKRWHVVVFYLGLVCDAAGTTVMARIAEAGGGAGGLTLHSVTGFLAIALMLFHAVWATIVLARHDERMKRVFHRFSIAVWIVWLIPYITGMVLGMGG